MQSKELGGEGEISSTFEKVSNPIVNYCSMKDAYNYAHQSLTNNRSFINVFKSVNRSYVFGSVPWIEQTVAIDVLKKVKLYDFREGFNKGFMNALSGDYQLAKKTSLIICSGSGGLVGGLVATPFLTLGYPVYGVGTGFYRAGIPGAAYGFVAGIYNGLTFSIRNAHRNILHKNQKNDFLELPKADLHQLNEGNAMIWNLANPNTLFSSRKTEVRKRAESSLLQKHTGSEKDEQLELPGEMFCLD